MCEIMITTEFTQLYVHVHVDHTDCLCHTAEMVVVKPIWQLHTLIVMNSCTSLFSSVQFIDLITQECHIPNGRSWAPISVVGDGDDIITELA